MGYSFYDLLWIYLIYSFVGWCVEVCAAVIQKRKFVNRGFVMGPLCPIYGTGAVFFALILPGLRDNPFFMFIGGMILASFVEFITGALLEKIFHKKWWDYSKEKFNFDGYICLKYSLVWGVCALGSIYLVNPFLGKMIHLLPKVIGTIIVLIILGFLILDFVATSWALLGYKKRVERLSQITQGMKTTSKFLENAITAKIEKHMKKAFPSIEEIEELKKRQQEKKAEESRIFGAGCSFYKLVSLFFIGAFLGDITETIFCWITMGRMMSRSSVVYGPFSIVWGLACALLTVILYRYKEKNDGYIFIAGTILGGAYEYICSVFTEMVFGTIFWDYSGFAFNLGGRINLLYCFFWGIAAVLWIKIIYPRLSSLIEKIPVKPGKIVANLLIIFMIVNMALSSLALARYTQRNTSDQTALSENGFTGWLDEHFTDERMERIYPNAKIVN